MKKDLNRRKFVKLASKVTLAASLFPGCARLSSRKKTERKISSENNAFDYIVIGSGAGGGPVVARLVKAGFRVLLIEAGGDETNKNIEIPAFHGKSTEDPKFSWEFFVRHYEYRLRQAENSKFNKSENGIFYPRATGLGGCTIHNAMITMYPDNSDWDYLQNITGDKSWNHRNMRKYFQRVENNNYYHRPLRSPTVRGVLNREKMGFNGWLSTEQTSPSLLLRDKKFLKMFFSALREEGILNELGEILGDTKSLKLDPNTWSYVQNKLDGIFNVPKATKNGRRSSTRELILETKKQYPHLLTIKTHTLAERVVLDDEKRAIGVLVHEGHDLYQASPNYKQSNKKVKKFYRCEKEIIVSGGAFNSPQLLMLSGIGERENLNSLGIETLVDLPGVGKNLQDRYEVTVVSEMNEDFTLLKNCTFGEGGDQCLTDYYLNPKDSVYATNGVIAGIIKRSRPELNDPDLFIFGLPGKFTGYYKGWSKDALMTNYFTWAIIKGHTNNQSGEVRLKSNSPFERPDILFRYFQESKENFSEDIAAVMEGIDTVKRINSKMKSMIKKEVFPGDRYNTKDKMQNFITNEAWGHHASCSNKIGSDNDPFSVLDSKFRVRGTKGLRVVDASSFNKIPGLFIVVPIYMIAEKAAEDIIDDASEFF